MNRSEFYQSLTLWFVAAIFIQTSSGNAGEGLEIVVFLALAVVLGLPLYFLARGFLALF
ncbi:hypothetical protein [Haloarchaeobius sp. TZWSO28]|uniref:hypothetical protein n=1 Tax=Haloarchaeobius sp. TZWSO28 TaxID=3446119 RepID=UPI003EBA1A2E